MKLDDMFKRVLVRSGQFLIDQNNIELDIHRFRIIVKDALSTYSRANPYDEHIYYKTGAQRRIRLDENTVKSLTGKDYLGVPDWVSDAAPMRLYGLNPYLVFKNLDPRRNSELVDKTQMPWTYRKPDLYLPVSAEWDIHAVWNHRIVEREDDIDGFIYEVPTLEEYDCEIFLKLLQGLFLQGIGRSRRAFTMNDLPIIMDGAEIAAEGVELEKEAIEELENVQKFYLAW